MATPFRLKRSAIASKRPATTDLQLGELALNTYDGYLYTEREGVGLATVTNLTPWYENYGGGSIYYSNSVGIGTTVPQYNLDVRKGSIGGYDTLVAQHSDVIKVIAVTVASKTDDHRYQGQGSGNAYLLDGIQAPILTLTPGRTYRFTNDNTGSHPFKFYLEADKTTNYTTGVNFQNTYTEITISDETPNVLHYQCTAHAYMGNAIVTNSNVVNSNYAATLRGGLDVTSGDVDITQNLNVTGNLDVDGDTTLDITTIDGLLDINAGGQANTFKVEDLTSGRVVIAGTSGELEDSGNLTFNGTDLSASSLIVSDLTSGRVVLAGGSGAVEDNANLKFNTTTSEFEVVGHTILDSLNVSGISTFQNNVHLLDNDKLLFGTGTGDLEIHHTGSGSVINDIGTGHLHIRVSGSNRINIQPDNVQLCHSGNSKLETTSTGVSITGNNVVSGNVSAVDGAFSGDLTVTGNVGIAGTLTYEDVSRVDAVGLSTFREGLFIPDNQKAQFGNAAGSADLEIYHDGSHSYIHDGGTGNLKVRSNNFRVSNADESKVSATFVPSGAVELYHNDSKKLETTSNGITASGTQHIFSSGTSGDCTVIIEADTDNNAEDENPKLVFKQDGGIEEAAIGMNLANVNANAANEFFIANGINEGAIVVATGSTAGYQNSTERVRILQDGNIKITGDVAVAGVTTSTGGFVGNLTGNVTGTATLATDLAINGTNQIVYQDSNNDSDVLPTGTAGQILASSGAGAAPQWVNSAPAGAIEGITIRDESSIVGTANSISTINFVGNGVVADAAVAAGIATVTINAGVAVSEGSGTKATGATGLDFVGPLIGVDASSNTGISTVRVDALTIKDEGSTVGTAGSITTINFVGAGIAAAVSGDTATVTSAGGVTNADVVALAIALG